MVNKSKYLRLPGPTHTRGHTRSCLGSASFAVPSHNYWPRAWAARSVRRLRPDPRRCSLPSRSPRRATMCRIGTITIRLIRRFHHSSTTISLGEPVGGGGVPIVKERHPVSILPSQRSCSAYSSLRNPTVIDIAPRLPPPPNHARSSSYPAAAYHPVIIILLRLRDCART